MEGECTVTKRQRKHIGVTATMETLSLFSLSFWAKMQYSFIFVHGARTSKYRVILWCGEGERGKACGGLGKGGSALKTAFHPTPALPSPTRFPSPLPTTSGRRRCSIIGVDCPKQTGVIKNISPSLSLPFHLSLLSLPSITFVAVD